MRIQAWRRLWPPFCMKVKKNRAQRRKSAVRLEYPVQADGFCLQSCLRVIEREHTVCMSRWSWHAYVIGEVRLSRTQQDVEVHSTRRYEKPTELLSSDRRHERMGTSPYSYIWSKAFKICGKYSRSLRRSRERVFTLVYNMV